ncbi:MAG: hypothetical protein ACUZ8I_10445 [Candidatus Scalindua sp.]
MSRTKDCETSRHKLQNMTFPVYGYPDSTVFNGGVDIIDKGCNYLLQSLEPCCSHSKMVIIGYVDTGEKRCSRCQRVI